MDKDKLHKKLLKEMRKKVKETHDEKLAFDFVWSRYKPAIEKAVFDLEVKLSAEEKKKRYKGTIFELEVKIHKFTHCMMFGKECVFTVLP